MNNYYILFNDSILDKCESTIEQPLKFFEYIFSIKKDSYDLVINELMTFKYLYIRKEYITYNDDGTVNEVEIRLRKTNTYPKTGFDYSKNIFKEQFQVDNQTIIKEHNVKEDYLIPLLQNELEKSKKFLLNKSAQYNNPISFINSQKVLIQNLVEKNTNLIDLKEEGYLLIIEEIYRLLSSLENPFLKEKQIFFIELPNQKSSTDLSKNTIPEYITPHSFSIIVNEGENQKDKIEKLFDLLIKNKIIECFKDEFYKAFTNQKVSSGIKWLVKNSKNKNQTNKPALFRFLNGLVEYKIIDSNYHSNENKLILNVFRNPDGSKFTKNQVTTSKSSMNSKTPIEKEFQEIFSQL